MRKYLVCVTTTFAQDGHGEWGSHDVTVNAETETDAIHAANEFVLEGSEEGTIISDSKIVGYMDEDHKEKYYKVYIQNGWGAEKFYIDDENQDNVIFKAHSEEKAIFQAAEYIRETSIYDPETTEEWINKQNWYAEEVKIHE